MDSLTTILVASTVIAEEWRQTNRSRPREGYSLVVVRREDPADMGQAPGQAEERSELRIFLAQDEARYQLRVRPFPVSGDTSTTLAGVVMELSSLRHNMVSYEALYPAAVEVRNNLGDEIWDGLENFRCRVAYLAYATVRQESADTIDHPKGFRDFLDQYIPHMETYIMDRWGEDDRDLFQCVHEDLKDIVEDDTDEVIEIQEGWPMQIIKPWFRHQPIFWLAYNLFVPAEGRMSWEQVWMWAIQCLRRTHLEPPAWPIQLRGLYVWNPDTTPIWNRAVLEAFADIRRRFRSIHEVV